MEEYLKSCASKIRGQPGVKSIQLSVCGTGRVGAHYEFTTLDDFKAYMGSPFYNEFVEEFKSQPWFDASKEPTEFVSVFQPNV